MHQLYQHYEVHAAELLALGVTLSVLSVFEHLLLVRHHPPVHPDRQSLEPPDCHHADGLCLVRFDATRRRRRLPPVRQ